MDDIKDKILICDDMETFLRLEKMLLERTGFDIIMAKSGGEAIKKIQQEKPKLVFLDLVMPDMNGDAICRYVKTNKSLKHIPVIMVTTRSDPESRDRCVQSGCDDYITKPVTQRDLFDKIKKFVPVERRRHPRFSLRLTVTATGKALTFTDFSYDVSEGGIFVETQSPLAVGTHLALEFTLPENPDPIKAKGKIARAVPPEQALPGKPAGMGIQFLELSSQDAARIKSFITQDSK